MTCAADCSSFLASTKPSNGKVAARNTKSTAHIFGSHAVKDTRRRVAGHLRRERLSEAASNLRTGGESEALHLHRRKMAERSEEQRFQDLQDEQIALAEKHYDEEDYLCQQYENSMQLENAEQESQPVSPKTTPDNL